MGRAQECPGLVCSTHQVQTQEVEDLPGVVLLQDLLERVFDEAGEGLRRVLQGVAHEVVEGDALGRVAHQGARLALLGRGGEDAGGCRGGGASCW